MTPKAVALRCAEICEAEVASMGNAAELSSERGAVITVRDEIRAFADTLPDDGEGYPGIAHDFERLKLEHDALKRKYAEIYDLYHGTPCEQIRKLQTRIAGRKRANIEVDDIGAAAWDNDNFEFDK